MCSERVFEKCLVDMGFKGVLSAEPVDFTDTDPHVCVVARTYEIQLSALLPFLISLVSSKYKNLHIYLLDTTGKFPECQTIATTVNYLYNKYVTGSIL